MKLTVIWVASIITIYLIILLINIFKKPTSTFIVEMGKIYQEEYTEGYIIRDEQLINIEDSKDGIVAIKSECEKVGKGEPIYRYCIENEEEINQKIQDVDKEIQDNLNLDEEFFSADIKIINSQIDNKIDNLCRSDDLQKINQDKSEINGFLMKKVKIRAEDSNNKVLQDLVKKRENYEKQLKEKSTYITAETSGVISYRVDGLEESLSMNDYSNLNEKYLKGLDIETGEIIASSNGYGKIVDNFRCSVVCLLDSKEAEECEIGKTVKLRLSNAQEIPAKIIYKKKQDSGKQLLAFEINNSVADLIKYRKISFDVIWWSDSGIKVANSAIKYEGDFAYVIRNRAGLKEKILVKILRSNDKYSIVENYTYAELKEAGYDTSTLPNNRKLISVHDQVEI